MQTEAQKHTMDYEPGKGKKLEREKERKVIAWKWKQESDFFTSNARKCNGNEIEQSILFPLFFEPINLLT